MSVWCGSEEIGGDEEDEEGRGRWKGKARTVCASPWEALEHISRWFDRCRNENLTYPIMLM